MTEPARPPADEPAGAPAPPAPPSEPSDWARPGPSGEQHPPVSAPERRPSGAVLRLGHDLRARLRPAVPGLQRAGVGCRRRVGPAPVRAAGVPPGWGPPSSGPGARRPAGARRRPGRVSRTAGDRRRPIPACRRGGGRRRPGLGAPPGWGPRRGTLPGGVARRGVRWRRHRRPTPPAEAGGGGFRYAVRRRAPGRGAGHLRAGHRGAGGGDRLGPGLAAGDLFRSGLQERRRCLGLRERSPRWVCWPALRRSSSACSAGGRSAGRPRPPRSSSPVAGWRWPGSAAARRGPCSACWAWAWPCCSP